VPTAHTELLPNYGAFDGSQCIVPGSLEPSFPWCVGDLDCRTCFLSPNIPVPHHPTPARQTAQPLDHSTAPYTSAWANDPFNLSYVVSVLLAHSS
jgi:hypothetical protein